MGAAPGSRPAISTFMWRVSVEPAWVVTWTVVGPGSGSGIRASAEARDEDGEAS